MCAYTISGRLIVTNLRIIWHSMALPKVNLCKYLYTDSFKPQNLFNRGS